MYQKVIKAGFRPLNFSDVRSRGNDIVLVDFGEDLGGRLGDATLAEDEILTAAQNQFQLIVGAR
jgi:hypothetical protein